PSEYDLATTAQCREVDGLGEGCRQGHGERVRPELDANVLARKLLRAGDAIAVDDGPVAAAEICDCEAVAVEVDLGVAAGDGRVSQLNVDVVTTPEDDAAATSARESLSAPRLADGDHEFGVGFSHRGDLISRGPFSWRRIR